MPRKERNIATEDMTQVLGEIYLHSIEIGTLHRADPKWQEIYDYLKEQYKSKKKYTPERLTGLADYLMGQEVLK